MIALDIPGLAAGLLLIWDRERAIAIDEESWSLGLDINLVTQAEQILGTIIIGVLILPAVVLLALQ